MRRQTRSIVGITGAALLLPAVSQAVTQASNMPLAQFCVNLYQAGTQMYVPLLMFGIIVLGILNWNFGWVEIGPTMAKIFLSAFMLGGGLAYVASAVGQNLSTGLTFGVPALPRLDPLDLRPVVLGLTFLGLTLWQRRRQHDHALSVQR